MNIGILYICTGKYEMFFDDFYKSCEENFLTEHNKTYYVWTDSNDAKFNKQNVKKFEQRKLGWPFDTMMRFHMFCERKEDLKNNDYLFFFNANMIVHQKIGSEVIPTENKLVGALHPGLYWASESQFPYERNPVSKFFINYGDGKKYFQGCFNGGETKEFLDMSDALRKGIDQDVMGAGMIPCVHDESALNWYFAKRDPLVLDSGYVYPETWNLPFEKRIIQLDKSRRGGHNHLRS